MGGDESDITTGVNSSKNAVENNFLGPKDQSRLEELRNKRDKGFLTQSEKIEMFMLDELDQKGDYLVGKYYKDPNSLTEAEVQQLAVSLSRYYQQVEGMSGEEAARQSIYDLLTGNWGYRPHNYDYPYLGTKEQQEQYNKAYWESIANKSLLEKLFSSRPMDENEEYYREQYNIQKYLQSTDWERQVGRPVMNFVPGVSGWIYNAIDTAQGSYALGEGVGQIYHDGKFTTDAVLKVVDGVLTLAPVVTSSLIPKGNSTGATGSVILDKGTQIELAPGSNSIGNINSGKTGTMIFEQGSTPNANEMRAGSGFLNLGYDVVVKKEVNQNKVKTQDLYVEGIGKVDVYTPQNLDTKTILRMIEKKNQQTNSVLTQADLSKSQMTEIANRTWGKPSANNINTLFFQDSKGQIIRYDRPTRGAK
ncbi:hypothetical protein A9G11_09705 [Gilliamella sp. wkB108]|nr:hypothetical protein A9G11_09705 [Gilliamella apicola]